MSSVGPLLYHLLEKVLKTVESDPPVVRTVKIEMHSNLSPRYQTPSVKRILNVSSFLDPKFKSLLFLTEDNRKDIHQKVIHEAIPLVTLSVDSQTGDSGESA